MLGDLSQWLQVPIAIINPTELDYAGDPIEATTTEVRGFVQEKIQTVTNRAGKSVTSVSMIFLDGNDNDLIDYDILVRLPDGRKFSPQMIMRDTDFLGRLSMVRIFV